MRYNTFATEKIPLQKKNLTITLTIFNFYPSDLGNAKNQDN